MDVQVNGKTVGHFNEKTKQFTKKVKKSVHLFKKAHAWGISNEVIEQLRKLECIKIVVFDTEEQNYYVCLFSTFTEKAFERQFEGYEPQSFLPTEYWDQFDKDRKLIQKSKESGQKTVEDFQEVETTYLISYWDPKDETRKVGKAVGVREKDAFMKSRQDAIIVKVVKSGA